MPNRTWSILPLALCLLSAPNAGAQEDRAAPGAAIVAMLPAAAAIGSGWTAAGDPVRLVPSDVFRDGARIAYGGPAGARVVLTVLQVTNERVAVRAAWEAASKLYDGYRHDLAADEDFTASLAILPPPPGCAEAKRVEGADERDTFLTGVALCAADPDLILLAVASGVVGNERGYRAADTVIVTTLNGTPLGSAPGATPDPR
jgi:hypothetical protein